MVELPEENELVVAVVKKILPYGAFCVLPEYNNLEVFLHISEVAPRWIKNIHEFISEGQRHVVKIYRVDKEKNQVDVSLKRVSEEEKRRKLELLQTEKKSTKLLQLALANAKVDIKPEDARLKIEEKFEYLYDIFTEAADHGEAAVKDVDLPVVLKAAIVDIAKKSIKKPFVEVSATVTLKCYSENGIEIIKDALKLKTDNMKINYLGAPRYQFLLTAENYKDGERELDNVMEKIKIFAQKNNCDFKYENA